MGLLADGDLKRGALVAFLAVAGSQLLYRTGDGTPVLPGGGAAVRCGVRLVQHAFERRDNDGVATPSPASVGVVRSDL